MVTIEIVTYHQKKSGLWLDRGMASDEVRAYLREIGSQGGKNGRGTKKGVAARKGGDLKAHQSAAGKGGMLKRWRNHYAKENALHGTPIPEAYTDAVAAMTDAERSEALAAPKKRAGKKER